MTGSMKQFLHNKSHCGRALRAIRQNKNDLVKLIPLYSFITIVADLKTWNQMHWMLFQKIVLIGRLQRIMLAVVDRSDALFRLDFKCVHRVPWFDFKESLLNSIMKMTMQKSKGQINMMSQRVVTGISSSSSQMVQFPVPVRVVFSWKQAFHSYTFLIWKYPFFCFVLGYEKMGLLEHWKAKASGCAPR